jgi:hypothetical protein
MAGSKRSYQPWRRILAPEVKCETTFNMSPGELTYCNLFIYCGMTDKVPEL